MAAAVGDQPGPEPERLCFVCGQVKPRGVFHFNCLRALERLDRAMTKHGFNHEYKVIRSDDDATTLLLAEFLENEGECNFAAWLDDIVAWLHENKPEVWQDLAQRLPQQRQLVQQQEQQQQLRQQQQHIMPIRGFGGEGDGAAAAAVEAVRGGGAGDGASHGGAEGDGDEAIKISSGGDSSSSCSSTDTSDGERSSWFAFAEAARHSRLRRRRLTLRRCRFL